MIICMHVAFLTCLQTCLHGDYVLPTPRAGRAAAPSTAAHPRASDPSQPSGSPLPAALPYTASPWRPRLALRSHGEPAPATCPRILSPAQRPPLRRRSPRLVPTAPARRSSRSAVPALEGVATCSGAPRILEEQPHRRATGQAPPRRRHLGRARRHAAPSWAKCEYFHT